MRRRIILAFVAILAVSLFLAGTISLYLVRRASGDSARQLLLRQVNALVKSTHDQKGLAAIAQNNPANVYTTLIPFLQSVTSDKVEPTIEISAQGTHVLSVTSLKGIPDGALSAKSLVAGKAVSGVIGSTAYAVAPLFSVQLGSTTHIVAIALESPISAAGGNTWYFLVAGGVSLLVAGGIAAIISRRIAGHVVTAAGAAQQIASGDLATRINLSGREYPELAQLGSSINTMAENLERSRDLERQFLLSISHDLRTPLTSIRGYAEAIAEGVTDNYEQAARVLVAESDRLGRLIGDLLDLARIDARQFSLHLEYIDAAEVATRATDALRYEFDAIGVQLSLKPLASGLLILGDADRLGQVVANLVENAMKFARSTVVVEIVEDDGVVIAIEDDGPGIPPDDLPQVFDRHFTSGRGKSRSVGSGLGLAIVAELVGAMHGHIEVRSPLNTEGGSRFSVRFPLVDAARAHDVTPALS